MQWNVSEVISKIEKKAEAECRRLGRKIPFYTEDNVYRRDMAAENPGWWTNGFWAGMLWQLYAVTKNPLFLETARSTEEVMDRAMVEFTGLHHDVGFMWLLSTIADYKITGREEGKTKGLHAATLLAGRYNPDGKFLRAWNMDRIGWIIIDCMMNIQMLYWASEQTGDPRFKTIANNHAETTLKHLIREDGSTNHIAVLDPMTGEKIENRGGQGYDENSAWSRGQSWALYGFVRAYQHTGNEAFLAASKRAAHFFLSNVAMTNYVSLTDFRAPEEPVMWDTTATACAASGLLELAKVVPEHEKKLYRQGAEKMLDELVKNHCDFAPETDGILLHGSGRYHKGDIKDIDTSIIYGDYFLVEALLKLEDQNVELW